MPQPSLIVPAHSDLLAPPSPMTPLDGPKFFGPSSPAPPSPLTGIVPPLLEDTYPPASPDPPSELSGLLPPLPVGVDDELDQGQGSDGAGPYPPSSLKSPPSLSQAQPVGTTPPGSTSEVEMTSSPLHQRLDLSALQEHSSRLARDRAQVMGSHGSHKPVVRPHILYPAVTFCGTGIYLYLHTVFLLTGEGGIRCSIRCNSLIYYYNI